MIEETTKQVTPPELRNPTGKGGFGDNPGNRSDGRWSKENSKSYWLNYFDSLTESEFVEYPKAHKDMTMAAISAYARIEKQKDELKEFQEVANRTEGMPKQSLKVEGEIKTALVEFIDGQDKNTNTD
jgi:hypothetical protein